MLRFFKTLNAKLLIPVFILWGFIFLLLFWFVLHPTSEFVSKYIQYNMQWLSDSAYSICDGSLDELIRSGKSTDPKYQKIKKVRTLRQLEMFFRQNDMLGLVYLPGDKVLWHNRLPFDAKSIIPMAREYNQVVQLNLSGDYYSEYHFSFDPWQWHIVFIKKNSHFTPIVNRVNKAYIATSGILLVSLLFIFFIIKISIKNPISNIIAPLKKMKSHAFEVRLNLSF